MGDSGLRHGSQYSRVVSTSSQSSRAGSLRGEKKVMCRANLRLLGAFGLIPAAEGISKSRRARDTTLIVPFEAKLHTECRIFIDFRAHGPRAYGPVKIASRRPKGGHHQHLRPDRSPYVL